LAIFVILSLDFRLLTAGFIFSMSLAMAVLEIFEDSMIQATFTLTDKKGFFRVQKTSGYTKLQANSNDNMRLVRFLSLVQTSREPRRCLYTHSI
jgi:hypothetical protein